MADQQRARRARRERSYTPPFSGARAQPTSEYRQIHRRWIARLSATLPAGVPAARWSERPPGRPWPATFGDDDPDTGPTHDPDEQGGCLQCGGCCYYVTLDASLGADWGACTNARSEYDGRVVFEHWTCAAFTR